MALQPVVREFGRVADRSNGYRDVGRHGAQWLEGQGGDGAATRMEEDTELEEGEALVGGLPLDDLDSRFRYLDTKIEAVLGHCQKEFQGSLYPDRLGSKYGGYGTFLPTHVRGAPVLTGPPAPVSEPPRSRAAEERARRMPGGGSGAPSERVFKLSPKDMGAKNHMQVNGLSHPADVPTNIVMKGNTAKDGGSVEQKKGPNITFRFNVPKQGVDKHAQKAMYNGFGLDNSSSPSAEDPDDDVLSPSEDEVSPDRSPLDMIRIMTSYQRPHGGLLSPLLDFLYEPPEREKSVLGTKLNKKVATGSSLRPDLGLGSVSTKNENDAGKDKTAVKDKKENLPEKGKGRPLDRREAAQLLDSTKAGKKDGEFNRRTGKEGGANALKNKFPAKDGPREFDLKAEKAEGEFTVDLHDAAGKENDNKDLARSSCKERLLSLDSLKGGAAEVTTSGNREARKAKEDPIKDSRRSREVSLEPNVKDIVAKEPRKEKRKSGGNKDALKARKEDSLRKDVQKQPSRKEKEVVKALAFEGVVADKETPKEVPLEVKKKVKESNKDSHAQKEIKDRVKDAVKESRKDAKKESFKKEVNVRVGDGLGKEEPKDLPKASRDFSKEVLKDPGKWDGTDQGLKEVRGGKKTARKSGKEPKLVSKEKERDIGLAGDFLGQMANGSGAQPPAPQTVLPFFAGASVAETPAAGAFFPVGQMVLDNWVLCDKCQQWRLCLPGVSTEDLPEKWQCKMMTWLPGLNSCKYSEDVTTAAVYSALGYQNPALLHANPGLQTLQPALAPPSEPILDNGVREAKPAKVQRSSSKKGMGKKVGGSMPKPSTPNVKRTEMGSVKSKSLNDVVQHPAERPLDKGGLDTGTADDVGYTRVMAEKRKMKEKVKRMRTSEGDDMRPMKQTVREEDQRRVSSLWQDQEWNQAGKATAKVPVAVETNNGADGNAWIDSPDPEPSKQQKVKLSQDASKVASAGVKRKKKTESSQDNDELRSAKKFKGEEARGWRGAEAPARRKTNGDDGDTRSLQYMSDEDAAQEGESGDRVGMSNKSVARGPPLGQALKKVKVTSAPAREPKHDDLQHARSDDRKLKEQRPFDVKCKTDFFEKQESSDSDEDKHYREDPPRTIGDKDVRRKTDSKEKNGQSDGKRRIKGDDIESGHHTEKKRMISKNEVKELGASREVAREEKKLQVKRMVVPSEKDFHEENCAGEQSPVELKVVKDAGRGKGTRLFNEVSGVAHNYVKPSLKARADESPNRESPLPDVGMYTEEGGHQTQKGGPQSRSPTSSSSKVSYSAESSAFGSKGASPIESTVSSSPVRSSKVDVAAMGRKVAEGAQNNHTSLGHPSDKCNSISPSPKRSIDQDADTQSDREGPVRQSHRAWDDRPHSSDPEREFRSSGRDPTRDGSGGRGREDRYAASNSRDGDFRAYDRSRNGRDDERYWEEARETRAGSSSYFPERYDRHRDDRYREREDSVDRYRDRDNRYDRRINREDRFRERDRDRERDRERDRSRENWPIDRGGDSREDRYSRERSVRLDWGRPSSRESRLDKQGGLNWRDEVKLGRDGGHEGRDRVEDENGEIKHETRSNPVEDSKDEHPGEDENDAVQGVQNDDFGHRYEKNDAGPQKDGKSHFGRVPPPGQASHSWEVDRAGVMSSGRKDLDAVAPREGQTLATNVNSRLRVEGQQSSLGSMSVRGKGSQVDGAALDVRIVEGGKLGKEVKKGADDDTLVRLGSTKVLGSSGHVIRSSEGISGSPSKKEHAALAQGLIKEAKDLKHSADRLKTVEGESTNLYLQAALKFLQAAHHLEMSSTESVRQGDTTQSMQMYIDTARLCDFCATTYERQKDLAAAALAHICAAVARFRVMMGKSASLNKDCVELQNAASSVAPGHQVAVVQTPPTGLPPPPQPSRASEKPGSSRGVGVVSMIGESPSSSSASDVDNLNNHPSASDKVLTANVVKGTALSPLPGSTSGSTDLVPLRLHSNLHRVIRNAMDLGVMMESWTKAQSATAAAETACAAMPRRLEGMLAVRRVGEIGLLGNMDAVVRQVRLALEAIGH